MVILNQREGDVPGCKPGSGAGKMMAQWVNSLGHKPDDLNSISRSCVRIEAESTLQTSDLYMHTVARVSLPKQTQQNKALNPGSA